jgi:hypothetical protein
MNAEQFDRDKVIKRQEFLAKKAELTPEETAEFQENAKKLLPGADDSAKPDPAANIKENVEAKTNKDTKKKDSQDKSKDESPLVQALLKELEASRAANAAIMEKLQSVEGVSVNDVPENVWTEIKEKPIVRVAAFKTIADENGEVKYAIGLQFKEKQKDISGQIIEVWKISWLTQKGEVVFSDMLYEDFYKISERVYGTIKGIEVTKLTKKTGTTQSVKYNFFVDGNGQARVSQSEGGTVPLLQTKEARTYSIEFPCGLVASLPESSLNL